MSIGEALAALQKEFDERPDVIDLKRRIDRCEGGAPAVASRRRRSQGVTKQGSFRLKVRTRKQRTVIPRSGSSPDSARRRSSGAPLSPSVRPRALLGKGTFDDCCRGRGQGSRCDG